ANGLSKQNVDAFYVSEERLEKALATGNWPVVIVDGTIEQVSVVAKLACEKAPGHLVSVISAYDAPATGNVKGFLRPFLRPRSFAVSIMRQGAQLDLEV